MKQFSSALGSMSVKLNSWSERSALWMSEPCAAAARWMVLRLRLPRRVLSGDGGGFIRDAVVRHNTMPSVSAGAFFFLKNGAVLTGGSPLRQRLFFAFPRHQQGGSVTCLSLGKHLPL